MCDIVKYLIKVQYAYYIVNSNKGRGRNAFIKPQIFLSEKY